MVRCCWKESSKSAVNCCTNTFNTEILKNFLQARILETLYWLHVTFCLEAIQDMQQPSPSSLLLPLSLVCCSFPPLQFVPALYTVITCPNKASLVGKLRDNLILKGYLSKFPISPKPTVFGLTVKGSGTAVLQVSDGKKAKINYRNSCKEQ